MHKYFEFQLQCKTYYIINTILFQLLQHALFSLKQKCAKAQSKIQTGVSIVRSHTHMPSHPNHGPRRMVVGYTEPVLAADRPGPLSESPNRDCYRCHVDFAESVARISGLA